MGINGTIKNAAPDESTPNVRCCWCFTPRENPVDRKAKCGHCGKMGTTTYTEKQTRNIYVEDIPEGVVP